MEAEAIFQELVELEPDNSNGYIGLGTSLSLGGKLESAVDAYQTALKLSPNSTDALIGLGSAFLMMADYSKAEDCYTQALIFVPGNPNAHWGLALALDYQGRVAEAKEHLEWILENEPNSSLSDYAREKILEFP